MGLLKITLKFQSDYDVLVCFPVNAIVLLKIFN